MMEINTVPNNDDISSSWLNDIEIICSDEGPFRSKEVPAVAIAGRAYNPCECSPMYKVELRRDSKQVTKKKLRTNELTDN